MSGYGLFEAGGKRFVGNRKRSIAGGIARWAIVAVVVLFIALVGAAVYARGLWQQWMANQAIEAFEWQHLRLTLDGIRADSFSLVSADPARPFRVKGSGFVMGWNWQELTMTAVRIEQLDVEVPSWPDSSSDPAGTRKSLVPQQLPAWLPESIAVNELVASLPGDTRIEGELRMTLAQEPDQWQLQTAGLRVRLSLPGLAPAGWRLQGAMANIELSGIASVDSARMKLLEGSVLRVDQVSPSEDSEPLQVNQAELRANGVTVQAGYVLTDLRLENLQLAGPVRLNAGELRQPILKTQSWEFAGQLDANMDGFDLRGEAGNASGLALEMDTRLPFDGTPEVIVSAEMRGGDAGHSLAGTLKQWPAMIETTEGGVSLQARVRLPGTGPAMEATIRADGLSGILDRMAWSGLSGTVQLSYEDALVVRTSDIALAQVNPGVPLGPVSLSGRYEAPAQGLMDGSLSVVRARAGFLGGELRVRPGQWSLANLPITVPVWLNGIQVDRLMKVYPAEGLDGTGTLQGEVPLVIDRDGVEIAAGNIEAVAPGGTLKLPADRLQALARNNEAMDLVVRALQNFNYSVLNSTIDYDQDGTLNLGLRLEGSNPQVRDGHPVVVNINLQEDVPALLTSLQLSGRVNEAVTERVRKLMEKREAGKADNGSAAPATTNGGNL